MSAGNERGEDPADAVRSRLHRLALPGNSGVNLMNAPVYGIGAGSYTALHAGVHSSIRRAHDRCHGGAWHGPCPRLAGRCRRRCRCRRPARHPHALPRAPAGANHVHRLAIPYLARCMDTACAAWQSGTGTRAPGAMRCARKMLSSTAVSPGRTPHRPDVRHRTRLHPGRA